LQFSSLSLSSCTLVIENAVMIVLDRWALTFHQIYA